MGMGFSDFPSKTSFNRERLQKKGRHFAGPFIEQEEV
jgi:hypothetical protein